MGDGDLSQATETSTLGPALTDANQRTPKRCFRRAPARFMSARLATSLLIGCALLPAAGCGGNSGRNVTPLAEADASTSTTAVSGDNGSAPSTTSEVSKAPDVEPPGPNGSTETTVTPTSAPSAERFADGSVVSAGGYEAKTPAVARGLLLEPEWTDEQQEAADVIHEYLDAMITTITDTKPDTTIPTSMTDLERPDLNSAGLVQLDTQNLVRGMTKTGGYWVDPIDSQSAYWVSELDKLTGGRMQIGMCEYNEFQRLALENDYLIDGDAGTAYWDGQIAPTKPGWRIVTLLHQGTEKGRTGCAA